MNDYIYFRRELDYLYRLYNLSIGNYTALNQYLPATSTNDDINLTTIVGEAFNIDNQSQLGITILLAALSMNKITRLFKNVLLQIVAKDISIRMNGKALLRLEHILSAREMRYIFAQSPTIETGFSNLLVLYPAQTIIEHFKYMYFKREPLLNYCDRFELELPIEEIITEIEKINMTEYIQMSIKKILPASVGLLTNFRIITL